MIRIYENLSTKFSNLVNKKIIIKLENINLGARISSLFSSKSCQLCNETLGRHAYFCDECDQDLPRIQTKCCVCCLPLTSEYPDRLTLKLICGECLTLTPSFTMTLCPFKYEFPVKQVIRQIKYTKQRYWIKALCEPFKQAYFLAYQDQTQTKPDLLIAIPMHKSKQKQRSYNQAELIAAVLSKSTGVATSKNILIKVKSTETQAQLSRHERMKNLSDSFCISKKAFKQGTVIDRHIALIDDVMTTKATCELASKLLLENGAKRVDVWCLARTPKMK